jgi:alkaline phosphatase D
MKLRPLTVGPIVGETTPTRVRIWGRSEVSLHENLPMRSFGAVRVKESKPNAPWSTPQKFKMNPNFDMTGVGVVSQLEPSTTYDYQVGHYFSDGEMNDGRFVEKDWEDANKGSFTTASDDPKAPRSIVVGSCRYLLKTFLGDFFDDRGDKTFRSVIGQIEEDARATHQLLMIGDQIYADDLSALNPDKTVAQFYKRYRDAFSQPHIRKLMSLVPTYMTLDDHEIEDNWPAKATDEDKVTLYPNAMHAYQTYQLSHSPGILIQKGNLAGTPSKFWYTYADGCTDVFVTDSRTERLIGERPLRERRMLSDEQFKALNDWLVDGSGRVKLVVTSVPFFPDVGDTENEDKWSGFPAQRAAILQVIETHKVKPVVFLSGDVHASMSAELVSPTGLRIYSVISSSFFWPYPHPSARQFQTTGTIDGGEAGEFTLKNASKCISDDNFTRLTISPKKMDVEVFERKGKSVAATTHQF